MRHRVKKKTLGRATDHRNSLFRNLARQVITHGSIQTTKPKAKEVQRILDKLITKAKKNDLNARRNLHRFFGKRDVVNALVDRVAPATKDRKSGFCSVTELGKRKGDNAVMARLELIDKPEGLGSLDKVEKKKKKEKKKETKKEK
ncbi:MAG: 50S ribosomal protein L17 [Patescibacteria group bacterium]|nr:50S ribosomal protein L17 [Patescibacteria group bacterium]